MNETIDVIFSADGLIQKEKKDYVPRESQIEAAHRIYDALQEHKHFILEGPCGFGKTFAYLIPTFEYFYNDLSGNIIVVTDGINLQEQLMLKDIPLVQKIFSNIYGREIPCALLKGKKNFLCKRKFLTIEAYGFRNAEVDTSKIAMWARKTTTGNISEFPHQIPPEIEDQLVCSRDGECEGNHCPQYNSCFYQIHKAKALGANIIITNYHVLFSDWKIGKGNLLPEYSVLVFDEAHEFANKFRDFRLAKVSLNTLRYLKKDIENLLEKYKEIMAELSLQAERAQERINNYTAYIMDNAAEYFEWMYGMHFKDDKYEQSIVVDPYTYLNDDKRVNIINVIRDIRGCISVIEDFLVECIEEHKGYGGDWDSKEYNMFKNGLVRLQQRCSEMANLMRNCFELCTSSDEVYWLDKSPDIKEKFKPNQRTSISNKPIEVGRDIFSSFLRREDLSCIFTSATLSTNGNFNFIKAQTGICECPPERVWEYIGESPFDLTKQQWWYFPENTVAGNDPKFAESLPLHIEQIVGACEGGALCLFTSVSNMRKTYEIVAPILEAKYGIRSFMQYQAPAPVLIDEFKNDVDSVLFATRSFFTGVDVPGYALRCLIIDKLPFPMAGDPMMEKLVQLYGFGGMFENYSVPMMLITLKQAVGRGVRSIHDKCVVSILDSRMLKTERERFSRRSCYKDQFRPTFPWNRGSQKLDDIKRFLFPGKEI